MATVVQRFLRARLPSEPGVRARGSLRDSPATKKPLVKLFQRVEGVTAASQVVSCDSEDVSGKADNREAGVVNPQRLPLGAADDVGR